MTKLQEYILTGILKDVNAKEKCREKWMKVKFISGVPNLQKRANIRKEYELALNALRRTRRKHWDVICDCRRR